MEFTNASTGNPGSTHDATVLRYSDLFQNSDKIPNGYFILGDSAFPIMEWLITPFRDCGNLNQQQTSFNHVHNKCRLVIKRAFGILTCRLRRLFSFDSCNMHMLVNYVLSACVLHNLCVLESDVFDVPEVNENDICKDDLFARDGQQIRGIQLRQQMMDQL